MGLNVCSKCGAEPVEQTRGQMKPEDHHAQHRRYHGAVKFQDEFGVRLPTRQFREDCHNVENHEDHATDMRVSCPGCGNATGWDRRDIEQFKKIADGNHVRIPVTPHGNVDNIRKRWNDANPVK